MAAAKRRGGSTADRAAHLLLGEEGERRAARFLVEQGGEILARNYRWSRAEIDLVVRFPDGLHFVEVKTRRWRDAEAAARAVDRRKQRSLLAAASRYMEDAGYAGDFQFDIVVAILGVGGDAELRWRRDAFGFMN